MYSIDKIAEFFLDNCPWKHGKQTKQQAIEMLLKHIEYGTLIVLNDKHGISALVRFNLNGTTAHVLDCVVRKDKRSFLFIKQLLKYGMKKYGLSRLIWERAKYPNHKQKEYKG